MPKTIFNPLLDSGLQKISNSELPVGGDTTQVLAKKTGTDYDTEWVDQSVGVDTKSIKLAWIAQ